MMVTENQSQTSVIFMLAHGAVPPALAQKCSSQVHGLGRGEQLLVFVRSGQRLLPH